MAEVEEVTMSDLESYRQTGWRGKREQPELEGDQATRSGHQDDDDESVPPLCLRAQNRLACRCALA